MSHVSWLIRDFEIEPVASHVSARNYKHAASTTRAAVQRLIDRHRAFIIACSSYWYPSLSRDHTGWAVPDKDCIDFLHDELDRECVVIVIKLPRAYNEDNLLRLYIASTVST